MDFAAYFSPKRFWQLLKVDVRILALSFTITLGVILGTLFLNSLGWNFSSDDMSEFHSIFFPLTLLISGVVVTSFAFNEIHDERKSNFYFTLPASIIEKFISRWLLTSIVFVLFTTMAYAAGSVIIQRFYALFGNFRIPVFNPFETTFVCSIKIYLIIHALFIFGAACFRNFRFGKVFLSLFAIALVIIIFTVIAFRIVFFNFFDGFSLYLASDLPVLNPKKLVDMTCGFFVPMIKILFWWTLAPLFWIITIFRLKEKEV